MTATFITLYDCMQLYHFSKLDKEDRDAVKEFIFDEIVPTLSEAQKGYLSFRKRLSVKFLSHRRRMKPTMKSPGSMMLLANVSGS